MVPELLQLCDMDLIPAQVKRSPKRLILLLLRYLGYRSLTAPEDTLRHFNAITGGRKAGSELHRHTLVTTRRYARHRCDMF